MMRDLPGPFMVDIEEMQRSVPKFCGGGFNSQGRSNLVPHRRDDILSLLNIRSHEVTSTSSMSRSPSLPD
jgi:hypothetical protein